MLINVGTLRLEIGHFKEASEAFKEAIDIIEALLKKAPEGEEE